MSALADCRAPCRHFLDLVGEIVVVVVVVVDVVVDGAKITFLNNNYIL